MERVLAVPRKIGKDLHVSCDLPDISIPSVLDVSRPNKESTESDIYFFRYWAVLLDTNASDKNDKIIYWPVYINNFNSNILVKDLEIRSSYSTQEAQSKVNNCNLF